MWGRPFHSKQQKGFQPSRGKKGHYLINLLDYNSLPGSEDVTLAVEETSEIIMSVFEIEPQTNMDIHEKCETIFLETGEEDIGEITSSSAEQTS